MERCGKINASNSGSDSWTGIGVVAGFGAVVLIMQWPHRRNGEVTWKSELLQRLQEVRGNCKTSQEQEFARHARKRRNFRCGRHIGQVWCRCSPPSACPVGGVRGFQVTPPGKSVKAAPPSMSSTWTS